MQEFNRQLEIDVRGPVRIEWKSWNPKYIGGDHLRCSPFSLKERCAFSITPRIPISRTGEDARTLVYLMWSASFSRDYAIDFMNRQFSSKYSGWRADARVAFFNRDTKRLIGAFVFEGDEPPEKGSVYSGSPEWSSGQILGKLPEIAFLTESMGEDRYKLWPATKRTPDWFWHKRWYVDNCEKCKGIMPHLEPWGGRLWKRIMKGVYPPSARCLICGTFRPE